MVLAIVQNPLTRATSIEILTESDFRHALHRLRPGHKYEVEPSIVGYADPDADGIAAPVVDGQKYVEVSPEGHRTVLCKVFPA